MDKLAFSNPYYGKSFIEFVIDYFYRLFLMATGQLPIEQMVSDEVQVGVIAGVAASSALVGSFLVLRKMSMLANSLSHTLLMGVVLAYYFTVNPKGNGGASGAPMEALLAASLVMGFLTAFLTEFLVKSVKLQEDASMGLVFTAFFAMGILMVTILTREAHIGIEAVMGNADALNQGDLFWVYVILFINLLIFSLFFKEFVLTTFDSALALALGVSPFWFNYLLMGQVSVTSITAFRAVGVLLVLAFMTGPVITARLFCKTVRGLLISSVCIGMAAALIGVALTRHLLSLYGVALSTSGVVVCVILFIFLGAVGIKQIVAARICPEAGHSR